MGYPQTYNPNVDEQSNPDCFLFYYDKEGDEVVTAASRHSMSNTLVRSIDYNADKGYLLVIYDDQDIDLLYDDGSVGNVGALKNATITGSKGVNSVTFDPESDLVWIATDFGYVAINDERLEVTESRNYSKPLTMAAHIGNNVYVSDGETLFKAPYKSPRMALTNYTITNEFLPSVRFYPMTATRVLTAEPKENNVTTIRVQDITASGLETITERDMNYLSQIMPSKNGYAMTSYSALGDVYRSTGSIGFYSRPDDEKGRTYGSAWEPTTYYSGRPRKGLCSYTRGADGTYVLSRDFMLPNAPNAFLSRSMLWHPRYGMIVNTHGTDNVMPATSYTELALISGLKNGLWTPLSEVYRNPQQAYVGSTPLGMVTDPDDDRYLWQGSSFSGITRFNLDDPQDILHYSHPADEQASLPGYVKVHETSSWKRLSSFTDPAFDADNTLWSYFYDYDNSNLIIFRYLTAEDRRATKDAASARPWKTLTKNISDLGHITAKFLPLKASVNKNLLFFMSYKGLFVLDTNGTPDNPSDDKIAIFERLSDQDGNTLTLSSPNQLWEDPQTGVVWIATSIGLLYCTPRNLLQGQPVLNRVKVSRNDGTSLADYLLNGVEVSSISHDAEGRIWIATLGAGVVVTSSDGRKIYQEFNTDNSDIPSDKVYFIQYNPDTRSMMLSTDKGICEFFIGGQSASAGSDEVRAYPNPVDPDYYGWVTIDGLPDNSLVKIVDAKGHLVRELGRAEGGSIQWDVNNLHYKRVQTGVYYILSSSAGEGSSESRVGKILVMN